jgi:hypothetical protein
VESNRYVADHGGAVYEAAFGELIVANGEVHRGGVVPHEEIADLPLVPVLAPRKSLDHEHIEAQGQIGITEGAYLDDVSHA